MAASSEIRVALLLLEGSILYDIGTVHTVFGPGRPGTARPETPYVLTLAAADPGPVTTAAGVVLHADAGLEVLQEADLVVVGGSTPPLVAAQRLALDALAAAHARGARVMSICTGAFALAHAGVLDGRRATTHWAYCEQLAAEFPTVDVDPGVLYLDDGDVLTSAGLAAGMDLCLHVVRGDLGADAATALARWNVVAPHRDGGQAQYIDHPVPAHEGGGLAGTRRWALERLHEPLTVEVLARHSHMSPRTFARRFVAETGEAPKRWLTTQRIHHARRLLESTDLPVEEVARRSGFGSAAALRVHFGRATATRPTTYRRAFRGVGGEVTPTA
ncbi:helix-turn-helix domain-containing protein [Baekduia soli]|uniref:Helix-turn-helix domain-containing protein n=1 Tax=Baekduia soli TaxID=496014 RepID=A0A5B8UCK9_9ACTN|nr:helix-turn-helix domain-containing protein [Baekduia soli]QEC50392.1 helix-turn-helix domain-containing protein [Baekduia soli]